jgi:CPA1 family monovalent cation:H+ antiporter
MDPVTTVVVLMLAVAVFALLASKIGIPYPTMMVIGGLVICCVPRLHTVDLEPRLIFTLFLPPLLYGAAWQTSWKEFWTNRRPIFLLAVGLVLFTTAGVALLAMHFIPGFTWPTAFALGAIVSPPDAIAVTAMTKKIRLPKRIILLLEGESLVNDASALVALKFAIAATVTGQFSMAHAAGEFVLASGGGVLLGLLIGWTVAEIHLRMRDPLIETTITFLTPYATYLLGEQIHVSGVLATVAAGLYVSWRAPSIMKPQVRLETNAVWAFVLFMLNGFVFVLVGLGLPAVMKALPDFTVAQLIGYGVLLTTGMIVLRMAWVVPGTFLPWLLTRHRRKGDPRPSIAQTILLGWTGMRGVVSLAAALALPTVISTGQPFPNRGVIIFLSFFIILVTLVLQSLTLPMVVRLLGAQTAEDQAAEEREARLYAARVALSFLKDLTESTDAFGELGVELRTHYERRISRLESGPVALPISAVGIDTNFMDLQREALSAERQAIVELRANQKISTELFQRLMSDVDVEEMRVAGEG